MEWKDVEMEVLKDWIQRSTSRVRPLVIKMFCSGLFSVVT